MESNLVNTRLHISGKISADRTLLVTDLFTLFPSSFQNLLPMLESRYRIVIYNDNGFDTFNRTPHLRHNTIQEYAEDLITSLREKEIQNVTYLAHSVNALLAVFAAHKEHELFDKIILISAVPCLMREAAMPYPYGSVTDATDHLFEKIMESQERAEEPEQLPALLASAFSKMNTEKAKLVFRFIMAMDCREYLHKLTTPVMILQGVGDKISNNEASFFMHRHIPESFIVKIKAKGHLPHLHSPEEVLRAIEIFMHPVTC